ncbi:MAG TPA: carbamoyltransferase [Verrucomicrobiota bacterium]|nr:carbamoyltransferase [Verrucomicrobiota bacterium]HNU51841.1 carbamoyltransferase [Verrucomicrobiota bacterium]
MPAAPHILGLSAYYHDAAACLIQGDTIVAAAQEERFSRRKNDPGFPHAAVAFCLRQGKITPAQLDAVVFYDKPLLKFSRLLESYLAVAPGGWRTFPHVLPDWFAEKLDVRRTLRRELPGLDPRAVLGFTQHHQAHAASAFYPSPFATAAILTIDGVGEWATTTLGVGRDRHIEILRELRFPHSLGLLYSAFTAYCGFRINSGEYKLMGLAPYGEPRYAEAIRRELIDIQADGSFRLNLAYFDFLRGFTMTNERFHALLGGPPRQPEAPIEPRHLHVARSIQTVTEDVMLRLARHARDLTGQPCLCLAGGVALNCVANGLIHRQRLFDRIWIQPAAGDAGGALGAALAYWHLHLKADRSRPATAAPDADSMGSALLGPEYSDEEIEATLRAQDAVYTRLSPEALLDHTVHRLASEQVVGWFQGRMEFGPRALGNRSILGDPRSPRMQSVMNLKVKFRESFRPFAPVVLAQEASKYFDLDVDSPYMLLVAPVRPELRRPLPPGLAGLALLGTERSTLPAVTHVDYSARIQTVSPAQNPRLHALLTRWHAATGCAVLVNTSFNIRGEPIVCSPDDAYRCFVNTEMDALVLGSFVLDRAAQPRQPRPRPVPPQPD